MKLIAITGEAGAGKSTLAEAMQDIAPQTDLKGTGKLIREYLELTKENREMPIWMQMGELAPEETMRGLVQQSMQESAERGKDVILDGMPRIPGQVDWLAEQAEKMGYDLAVICVVCSAEISANRVRKRERVGDEYNEIRALKDHSRLKKTMSRLVATDGVDFYVVSTEGVSTEQLASNLVRMFGIV